MSPEISDKEMDTLTAISECYYKIFSRGKTAGVSKYRNNGSWEYEDTENKCIIPQEKALEILTQQAFG